MKRFTMALIAALGTALLAGAMAGPAAHAAERAGGREYVVAYKAGVSVARAKAAVRASGGRVVATRRAMRLMLVRSSSRGFVKAARASRVLAGVARNRVIGKAVPGDRSKPDVEREGRADAAGNGGVTLREQAAGDLAEPLSDRQWDMRMIGATPTGSYANQQGSKDVIVAVIDTGIDGSHPDIAPNFNKTLSRNWTTDIPLIDGECNKEPDRSCTDAGDVDEDGHGTHVAGTIAAPINGIGMAGVAPNVTLVNDRAGQDSGFFFLWETVNALKYAGDIGADVANMSFYTDPWQYNCPGTHPATNPVTGQPTDTPAEQAEQELVRTATQDAVDYAIAHGVTLVAAAGNFHNNLDTTTSYLDDTSPDYPPGSEKARLVTDWCRDMPTEADGVISVSAIGPSTAKADYSNFGAGEETGGTGDDPAGEIDVAAPGGYFRDFFGTPQFQQPQNMILGPYPLAIARANHEVNGAGKPTTPFVVRDCSAEKTNTGADPSPQPGAITDCAYYQLIQGTSMASPHAVGVAALIVSQFGTPDAVHGGLTMDPAAVRARLRDTATDHPCPTPGTVDYTQVGRPASWTATCLGTAAYNGFYGDGIVNAQAAVTP